MAGHPQYRSDRWITPGVIIAALIAGVFLVGIVAAGVTYLAARGVNPDPMIRLVAQVGTSVGMLGSLVLQLVNRTTTTKTERNTGVLAGVVADALVPALPTAADDVDEHLVDDEEDLQDTELQRRVPVPPIPTYPQHNRRHAR